ncbi:hypothetical protein Cpir12675_002018 [Ceratocystis pirilliformis]|uniref:LPXTG-motif cell wall anchor domain protein n=1 Tax=Ceratocystis pirilliformis TaxID=259994 RepID=A0ABR3ZD70_9PEZI
MLTGPHFSPANANSSRQNFKLQGSSNSSTGESSSQQTSLHSPFATNTLVATALVLSQTEQPKASTNSPIAPTNVAQTTISSPKSVATANTATTNTTQSSAVFTSSFFSASTSHLDDDLCSQVATATSSSTRLPFLRPQQQDLQSSQTFNALDLDSSHSRNLHLHRQNNNSSKLPTFRFADLVSPPGLLQPLPTSSPQSVEGPLPPSTSATRTLPVAKSHRRGKSENIPPKPSLLFKSATAPVGSLSVELKAAPTVVTTVSASASGLNRVLSPTSTGNSAPQRLQSVLKKPRENPSPKTTRLPPQARSPNQQNHQQETELHEDKTSLTKHQTQSQPSSKKTRARLSTSVVEGNKKPIPILSTASKRPASFPTSPRVTQVTFLEPPAAETPPLVAAKGASNRRSFVSSGTTSSGSRAPPISLRVHRVQAAVEAAGVISPTAGGFPNTAASPKAEVIPPSAKTDRDSLREHAIGHNKSSSDEKRSSVSRPPITIKPTPASPSTSNSAGSTPVVRVPPIRAFRASGTRRSLTLDTTTSLVLPEDNDDSLENANNTKKHTRQAALRALEGHNSDSIPQIMTPPGSGYDFNGDNDDTGDLFLKIAREDNGRNSISSPHEDAGFFSDDQRPRNTANRVSRASHRRPLSTVVPAHATPQSPSRLSRRLSDQQETSRSRGRSNDDTNSMAGPPPPPRTLTYRSIARELSSGASVVGDETGNKRPSNIRSLTSGSRSLVHQDTSPTEGAQHYSRRKPSISEGISLVTSSRSGTSKNGIPYHGRTYNSSPLAQKNTADQLSPHQKQHILEQQQQQQQQQQQDSQGQEGTDSTTSTGGPSTVWDELDDLKSRIHRLELTGKLPNSSSSAMSRVSDDRPATAHTAATTNSGSSPKRVAQNSGTNIAPHTNIVNNDNSSTASSQKETPSLLQAALAQAKPGVSNEVYRALELAATDALGLTTLMGTVGQPGPISSGASTIGFGGASTVTDRQLRRKAEGVVRSLTELCIALSTDSAQRPFSNTILQSIETAHDVPLSPTTIRGFNPIMTHNRASIAEQSPASIPTSPRSISKLEERRNKLLNSPVLPAPRFSAMSPSGPSLSMPGLGPENIQTPTQGRKSALLTSRRRAGTEEPEEQSGRKTSMLLRTRRAGTEEPEDINGRRTSMFIRGRRGAAGSDDEEPRMRPPSRAITEMTQIRPATRSGGDYSANAPAQSIECGANNSNSSAPRRRMASAISSRLGSVPPQSGVPTPRRFLERQMTDREAPSTVEKMHSDERLHRPMSLGHASMLGRTSSISRRATTRER